MPSSQVVHLELYAPNVKKAFANAQMLADRRKHSEVTPHHLLRVMLEEKWGYAPCIRAGLRPEKLLASANSAIDGMSSRATEPAYLGRTLLATMSRAERSLPEHGRDYVDFRLVYRALAAEGICPATIGDETWSRDELLGSRVEAPPTFDTALRASASILGGIGDEIRLALGVSHPPREIVGTLREIRARLVPPNDVPELSMTLTPDRLSLVREGTEREIVVEWLPPLDLLLRVVRGGETQIRKQFTLEEETNRWSSADDHLFSFLRAEIVRLYRDTEGGPSAEVTTVLAPTDSSDIGLDDGILGRR